MEYEGKECNHPSYLKKSGGGSRGTKEKTGKPQVHYVPYESIVMTSNAFTYGAGTKYGPYNWMKGIPFSEVYDALQRHLGKWFSPLFSDIDEESGLNHLDHAGADLSMLQYYISYMKQYGGFDDRPKLQIKKSTYWKTLCRKLSEFFGRIAQDS